MQLNRASSDQPSSVDGEKTWKQVATDANHQLGEEHPAGRGAGLVVVLTLAACGDGAPSDASAKVTPAAMPAPPADPAAPCCCATFHGDAVYTCEQGATSACEVFNNAKTGNRRA